MQVDQKQAIVQEIIRVAHEVAPKRLSSKEFFTKSQITQKKIRYNFGTWNNALQAAGLEPNPSGVHASGYKALSEEELFREIGQLWVRVGRRPTEDLMNSHGKFSARPYQKHWGRFSAAVNAYVQLYGEPQADHDSLKPEERPIQTPENPVVIPKTYKPATKQAQKRPIVYGEPLDFRGLRYAPVNEQGVVYLFGLVSRELGFLIESIRTDFPDCEGKRCLNREATKWEHVRIEFEYKSSAFQEHGHDPSLCELIVCWIHDWKDSPLEVLELKSAISVLPR